MTGKETVASTNSSLNVLQIFQKHVTTECFAGAPHGADRGLAAAALFTVPANPLLLSNMAAEQQLGKEPERPQTEVPKLSEFVAP